MTRKCGSAEEGTIVCCFFCVNGIKKTKDARAILRSIIFQILLQRRDLVRHALPVFTCDRDGKHVFQSYDNLWLIFANIAFNIGVGSVSIVIDAVDECGKANRDRLMENITQLIVRLRSMKSHRIRFFITSRPYVAIQMCFKGRAPHHLNLEENQVEIDNDSRRVVSERVRIRAELANAKPDTIAKWQNSLTETADRTFLWTKFILDILDEELLSSPGAFDRILLEIPRDLEATYARYLQKIVPRKEAFAMGLLRLVIASYIPLSVDELHVIVSFQEASQADYHSLARLERRYLHRNMEGDINLVLGPLIRIEKSKVYLVHLTLKEFLCKSIQDYPNDQVSPRYHID